MQLITNMIKMDVSGIDRRKCRHLQQSRYKLGGHVSLPNITMNMSTAGNSSRVHRIRRATFQSKLNFVPPFLHPAEQIAARVPSAQDKITSIWFAFLGFIA